MLEQKWEGKKKKVAYKSIEESLLLCSAACNQCSNEDKDNNISENKEKIQQFSSVSLSKKWQKLAANLSKCGAKVLWKQIKKSAAAVYCVSKNTATYLARVVLACKRRS